MFKPLYQNLFYMFRKMLNEVNKLKKNYPNIIQNVLLKKGHILAQICPTPLSVLSPNRFIFPWPRFFYKFASLKLPSNVWIGGQDHALPLGAMSS